MAPGPGVDIVYQGQDYDAPDGSFDTVISCEVMEHNPYWRETITNMVRMCRPGGLVLMTCASTGRREHGTTRSTVADSPLTVALGWEYYRNLNERDFRKALPLQDMFSECEFFANWTSKDIYLAGFKRGAPAPDNARTAFDAARRAYRHRNITQGLTGHYVALRALIAVAGEDRVNAWRFRGA